ncbi:MAG: glutamate racemase [Thermodesulfovibrio sp.]|nr:glutamate racemase [Thermodesulfovibrio sp.]MDW7998896.1 glutamate racemase [Thermodesulfovibrio sp.]
MREKPVGIFDSGVGGLTVLKEISNLIPNEDLIYLGDTARVPYGIRSAETVIRYSIECASFLFKKGIKMLVVACNTSSSVSLEVLKERLPISVIGVIEPGVKAALKATKNGKIGIIGTEATIHSEAYPKKIRQIEPDIQVISKACPLFVPLVEEGILEGSIAELIVERYLKELKKSGIDTLILGCTHYPLLKKTIQKYMEGIQLVDSAEEVSREVKKVLSHQGLINEKPDSGEKTFYVTDSPDRFKKIGEIFLNCKIENIFKVSLEEEKTK